MVCKEYDVWNILSVSTLGVERVKRSAFYMAFWHLPQYIAVVSKRCILLVCLFIIHTVQHEYN